MASVCLHEVPLFLHIPKTAGSTLAALVRANYERAPSSARAEADDRVYTYYGGFSIDEALAPPTPDKLAALGRPTLRAVTGHFVFGLHRYVPHPTTYFSVLRDPVARVLSLYAHEAVWLHDRHGVVSCGLTLDEFVRQRSREIDNGQIRRLCGLDFPIGRCSRKILTRTKDIIRRHFSFLGLTERFDETVLVLAGCLRWDEQLVLPRLVNRHRKDLDPPLAATLADIAELNRYEIELYRFVEELFDEHVERMGPQFTHQLTELRARQADLAERLAREPVNLNTGTEAELSGLPGIGPVLAHRIVDYRESNEGFERVQQLLEIRGIGSDRYWDLVMLVVT
jgi:competence ComEA-like helix-hairpin-helix protein